MRELWVGRYGEDGIENFRFTRNTVRRETRVSLDKATLVFLWAVVAFVFSFAIYPFGVRAIGVYWRRFKTGLR